jgi:hypothetical protein
MRLIISTKQNLNKILSFNFAHHVRIIDKAKNRSDRQDVDRFPKVKQNPKLDHMFDEVYLKGRGGREFIPKDKEGLKENFDRILSRTV